MKHIKIYEDFINEATKLNLQNDIFDSGLGGYKDWTFEPAKKKLTVTYDIGKWDNKGRYEKEIKWLATNDRSAMTSGNSLVGHLDLYLQPHGLEVDKKKQHKYDAAKGKVELNLTDANPDNHWYGHSVWENDQVNEAKKKIDLTEDNELDTSAKKLIVYFDEDGWDSYSRFQKDIKYLASNQNDPMATDIDDALEAEGFRIDTSKKHKYDADKGWVEFYLEKI